MLFHREGRGLLGADDQNVTWHRGRYLCTRWPDRHEGERGKGEPEYRAKTQPGDSEEKRLQHFLHGRTICLSGQVLKPVGYQSQPKGSPDSNQGGRGRSSRPSFLKAPISSLRFVFTDIASPPAAMAAFTVSLNRVVYQLH